MNPTDYHVPRTFKAGDRVVVVRDVKEAEAWYGKYDDMSPGYVKAVLRVKEEHILYGYLCLPNPKLGGIAFWYPSCALESAAAQTVVIEVPSI